MPNMPITIIDSDGNEVEGVYDPVDVDAYPTNHNIAIDGPLPDGATPEEERAAKPTKALGDDSDATGASKAQQAASKKD